MLRTSPALPAPTNKYTRAEVFDKPYRLIR